MNNSQLINRFYKNKSSLNSFHNKSYIKIIISINTNHCLPEQLKKDNNK